MSLITEIYEQPQVMRKLLSVEWEHIEEIVQQLNKYHYDYVFLAARGTSDNAGRYAQYLWGSFNQLPIALATPSLFSLYNKPPKLKNSLVIAVSQAGQSPDILSVIREAKKQGQPTLTITNAPDSPLAQESAFVIDIQAGEERAIAATKSYTAQLMVFAMLSLAMQKINHDEAYLERKSVLEKLPYWQEETLKLNDNIEKIVQRYRYMEQCVVLGRGYNYASAYEWSLKMKELSYVSAEPYSSADFLHGPIAVVERGFPVFSIASSGVVFDNLLELLQTLHSEHHAEMLIISDNERALSLADIPIPLPSGIPEWMSPLVSILPAQLFSYHLTHVKGFDVEAPRGLKKVTISV